MDSERFSTGHCSQCRGRVGESLKVIPRRVCRRIQVRRADSLMVRSRMVLGKVVGTICLTFAPVNLKLALANAIVYPVKMHLGRFRPFLFYSIGYNTTCSVIVRRHGRGRLWVAEFFKSNAERACYLAVVK